MKVSLVLCPGWYPRSPALGPALLKSFLESHGHQARVFDLAPELRRAASAALGRPTDFDDTGPLVDREWVARLLDRMEEAVDKALERILEDRPDVIGFTVYLTTWPMSTLLAEKIKERDPRVSIVLGGPEGVRFQSDPSRFSRYEPQLRGVDALVPGEGENPMLRLLENRRDGGFRPCPGAFVKDGGGFRWTSDVPVIEDLDSLPFPDFGDFKTEDYGGSGELVTYFSRGCPKQCVFCDVETYWKGWRNRSGRRVMDEIEWLLARHADVRELIFCDSILNANMKELLAFCRLLGERKKFGLRPVTWNGYAIVRPDMTSEACRELRVAGCTRLRFGIESGSQKVLNAMKKGCSVAAAEKTLKNCREAGIDTLALFMVGFPTETRENFGETLDFIGRNAQYISEVLPSGSFTYIDSGTPLYDSAAKSYGVDPKSFHPEYWRAADGANDYPERARRFHELCVFARERGVRVSLPEGVHAESQARQMAAYERFNRSLHA